jgi:hypothetical protein
MSLRGQAKALCKWTVGAVFATLIVWWGVSGSEKFRECIHTMKRQDSFHTIHDEMHLLAAATARARLNATCAFIAAGENGEAITALSTFILAAFTFTLWRATSGMLRVTESQEEHVRISAEAAHKSAVVAEKTLTDLNRPYLFVHVISFVPPNPDSTGESVSQPNFSLGYTNHGRTPAVLQESWLDVNIDARTPPPDNYLDSIFSSIDENHVVSAGELSPVNFIQLSEKMDPSKLEKFKHYELFIHCIGRVHYADIFGNEYKSAFCFIGMPNGGWQPSGSQKLNYRT